MTRSRLVKLLALCSLALQEEIFVSSFTIPPPAKSCQSSSIVCTDNRQNDVEQERLNFGKLLTSAVFVATVAVGNPVYADEYGIEKDAPTLYTGETVEVGQDREITFILQHFGEANTKFQLFSRFAPNEGRLEHA